MEKKKSFTIIFTLNFIIMSIYSMAIRWHFFINIAKLVCVIALYVIMLIILPLIAYKNEHISQYVISLYQSCVNCLKLAYSRRKKILIGFLVYVIATIIDVIGTKIAFSIIDQPVNEMITFLVVGITYLVITVFFLRKDLATKIEKLFFCCAIIIGSTLIMASPNISILTWDDGTHYSRTISLADFADEKGYAADDMVLYESIYTESEKDQYAKDYRIEYDKKVNESFAKREEGTLYRDFGIYSICYIPEASGIILGRAINLPFTWIIKLAKFFNLLFYSIVIYFAIRKLRFGKVLVATLALIPTIIYMASNFSYDPWVTCFMTYGFCSFFGFLQNREKRVSKKDMIFMLSAFVLGCIPKAIYFVIMFPLFLMPKTSFNSRKEYKEYLFWLLMSGLFLISTFLIPTLISGVGTGDQRGGTDVNSTGQIKFILTNPGTFLSVMINFLSEYLFIGNSSEFTVLFGWLGKGFIGRQATFIVCILVAILDREGIKSKNISMILVTVISFIANIFLIATVLYISYTPVGYYTINGCQYRYLLPILFPLLYVIFPDRIHNKLNKSLFNSIPLLFMSFIFLTNTMLLMSQYY